MTDKRVFDDISDAVGWTPLVRLNRSVAPTSSQVFAKIESMNPLGSVKERIARHMVRKALKDGRIKQGGVIIENSSGNTAMGLAMMANLYGLKCKMVVRKQTTKEKQDALRAMGVELVLVDGTLPPEDPESYNKKARVLAAENPDYFFPDQHNNRENSEAHYLTTGPEIWEQMEGRIDFFVAGIGTGGTICGVAKYLKEKDPHIRAIAVDPVGSVFTHFFKTGEVARPGPYAVEGLGEEEIIRCPDFDLIDDMVQIQDRDIFVATRDLARMEAIFVGGSSGAALCGVRHLLTNLDRPARIVTVFPDSGNRYMSTIFNDEWMRSRGYLP